MRLGTANPSTLFQRSLPIPGPEMYCLEIELKNKNKDREWIIFTDGINQSVMFLQFTKSNDFFNILLWQ